MLKTLPALAALVVASTLVVPTVSLADDTESVRVSYADLDLATQPGKFKLQRRISYAATTVCGTADGRELKMVQLIGECRNGAIAGAQPAFQSAVAAAERHGTVTVLDATALIVTAR